MSDAERYDLAADPFELNNLSPADPETPQHETEAVLRGRLAALRRCAGIEGRDPPPPGGYFRE
ncbi:MAG TPA: hypothetical protein VK387_05145 [Thermoleophilaceae bacterium]|nr:hypothetical protein [Thermoleophilaceae bacterium]